jgi:hypothetical protein
MPKKIKLSVELIPKTSHFINARSILKKSQWDKIRFLTYEKANHKCEICKQTGLEQGYKHKVECHEIWKYSKSKKIQKLIGLIALCPLCHQVKHIGRSIMIGKQEQTLKHLESINKWDQNQALEYINEAFKKCDELSKLNWTIDVSILKKEPYNLKCRAIKKTKKKRKRL